MGRWRAEAINPKQDLELPVYAWVGRALYQQGRLGNVGDLVT